MLAAGAQLGPYRIVAALGAGGMGEVYRAHDSRLGRDVAIKVLPPRSALSPDARARFEREARTISQLSHPHICALFDVGREGDADYLVMELLEGETLAHRVARGPLPVADVLKLGAEIASALDRAHAAGVVHRDLKPGNVMLTKSGAKLMDFGLARVVAAPASGAALSASPTMTQPLTSEGAIVGTFQYMAPEPLEGHEADARADIWALGCVLYEMATGRHAFAGESQASLIAAIMTGEPRPIAELQPLTPPALGHVVTRCLAKDPAERWQSARDVASVLEMTRSASGVQLLAPGATRQAARPRAVITVAAFAALALAVAVIAVIQTRRPHYPDPARVSYTRLTLERGTLWPARFAPDGKTVFYTASWEGRAPETFEVRPGFLVPRALGLEGAGMRAVSSTGTMAVILGQTIVTWPHPGTLAEVPLTGGTPRRIMDDVRMAEWAPDGRTVLVTHRVNGMVRLELPPGHVVFQSTGDLTQPRISPDGRRVAVIVHPMPSDMDNRGSVVVLDTTGRVLAKTREWNTPSGLAWSADGRDVWFAATDGLSSTDLRALSPDGRERVVARIDGYVWLHDIAPNGDLLLTRISTASMGIRGRALPAGQERELGWYDASNAVDLSQDGTSLLFLEVGLFGGPQYAVCLRGMDGSAPVRLGTGGGALFSPDGRRVLTLQLGPPQRLMLLPTGSGDTLSLPRGPIDHYELGMDWLPDGRHVVFSGSEPGRPSRIYVQDLVGGMPKAISAEGYSAGRVSPDGRFVAAAASDGRLVSYPLDGGDPKPVTALGRDEHIVNWSRDSKSVFSAQTGTSAPVTRIDIASGTRTHWNTLRMADSAGVMILAVVLARDGESYAYTYSKPQTDLYLVTGLK
jgi:eukaryotic-like serine/threonine-protein kinase